MRTRHWFLLSLLVAPMSLNSGCQKAEGEPTLDEVRSIAEKYRDVAVAKAAFVEAQSELMRAVSKGVVHPNTGSRKVSRLAARLKKLSAA